jgi:hypothetical protein
MKIPELQLGKAGEYLVCADLILKGYIAFPSEQGLSYDVVVDDKNTLIRIQVKTTQTYRAVGQRKNYCPSYLFNARRCGKGGRQSYENTDIDIMAFVCLEDNIIGYLPVHEVRQTLHFRVKKYQYKTKNLCGRYLEDLSIERAINGLQNNPRGLSGGNALLS